MSNVRLFKVENRLANAVDVQYGIQLQTVLQRAQDAVHARQDEMLPALRGWVAEIDGLCAEESPDAVRMAWLANGVLGVGGACGLEALARCGALFGRAIEIMERGGGWRRDAARIYASALVRILDGADRAADEAAVLASLEAMNRTLSGPEAE